MWRRQKAWARLHEELSTIALLDRLHECATHANSADDRTYAFRQIRRSQIVDEIEKRSASKVEYWNRTWISSAVLLLCAVGHASLHYLLK